MFRLRMAGAQWRDRIVAALGGAIGIALTGWLSAKIGPDGASTILLVAPIGASAVLVFAVPSSPLAQPWRVIGGNVVSALVGTLVAQWLGHDALAAGVAVGLAIAAMSLTGSLHPPGGGSALLPVLAPAVLAQGYGYALFPVGLNAVLLTACGWAVHRLNGHSYPHRITAAPPAPYLMPEDIDAALAEAGDSFDISRDDLVALFARAAQHGAARRG
ncbi:HPP family protein [Sphingomonas sp. RS6]